MIGVVHVAGIVEESIRVEFTQDRKTMKLMFMAVEDGSDCATDGNASVLYSAVISIPGKIDVSMVSARVSVCFVLS